MMTQTNFSKSYQIVALGIIAYIFVITIQEHKKIDLVNI